MILKYSSFRSISLFLKASILSLNVKLFVKKFVIRFHKTIFTYECFLFSVPKCFLTKKKCKLHSLKRIYILVQQENYINLVYISLDLYIELIWLHSIEYSQVFQINTLITVATYSDTIYNSTLMSFGI